MNFVLRIITGFLVCINYTGLVYATNRNLDSWYGFFNKAKINNDYSWWTETQLRYSLDNPKIKQTLVRTGALRAYKDYELGLLYAYIATGSEKEHRLALQHSMSYSNFIKFNLSHRIRVEYRPRENRNNLSERFRYLLRAEKNLYDSVDLVTWNEFFLNLRKESNTGNRVFERNRFFLGPKLKLNESFNLELGYLNQYIPRQSRETFEHVLIFYLFFS